jgi:hypothetical protein
MHSSTLHSNSTFDGSSCDWGDDSFAQPMKGGSIGSKTTSREPSIYLNDLEKIVESCAISSPSSKREPAICLNDLENNDSSEAFVGPKSTRETSICLNDLNNESGAIFPKSSREMSISLNDLNDESGAISPKSKRDTSISLTDLGSESLTNWGSTAVTRTSKEMSLNLNDLGLGSLRGSTTSTMSYGTSRRASKDMSLNLNDLESLDESGPFASRASRELSLCINTLEPVGEENTESTKPSSGSIDSIDIDNDGYGISMSENLHMDDLPSSRDWGSFMDSFRKRMGRSVNFRRRSSNLNDSQASLTVDGQPKARRKKVRFKNFPTIWG